jgi:tetratricopeptide (TPR) repeat protein
MNDTTPAPADIQTLLNDVYERFRVGRFDDTAVLLERALSVDYENAEVLTAMKSVHFWLERSARLEEIADDFERGEYLFKQWDAYVRFLEREKGSCERGIYAARQWVFGSALVSFTRVLENTAGRDPDLLFRIGRCYKGKGNYKQALEYFEASNHQRSDDPQILAELADCYANINEMKASKIFFREAFFLDPQRIDLGNLESTMMHRLIEQVRSAGVEGAALREWIPVYGVVFGVFNVKRELRSLEYGKLKQSIYSLESRLAEEGRRDFALEPRLLNRYFWLIDHLLAAGDDREKIDDVLVKIRALNSSIYEQYIN